MKFTTSAKGLKETLSIVKSAIPAKPTHPVLANYLFKLEGNTLEITATDLSLSISSKLQLTTIDNIDGSVVVTADIVPIINKLGSKEIVCEVKNGQFVISYQVKGKVASFECDTMDANEYPELDKIDAETLNISGEQFEKLKGAITFNLHSVSTDMSKQVLMAINFAGTDDGLKLASTDGHRLGVFKTDSIGEIQANVPATSCKNLLDLSGDVVLKKDVGYISFQDSKTRILARLLDGQYPNYESLLPSDYNFNFEVDCKAFLEAVELVSLVGNKEVVKISKESGEELLKLETFKNEQVVGVEFVEAKVHEDFKEIVFKDKYLISALKQFEGTIKIQGNTALSPHTIVPVDGDNIDGEPQAVEEKLHLLMPIQLRS